MWTLLQLIKLYMCFCVHVWVYLYDNFLKAALFDQARTFETLMETTKLSSEKVIQVYTPANRVWDHILLHTLQTLRSNDFFQWFFCPLQTNFSPIIKVIHIMVKKKKRKIRNRCLHLELFASVGSCPTKPLWLSLCPKERCGI